MSHGPGAWMTPGWMTQPSYGFISNSLSSPYIESSSPNFFIAATAIYARLWNAHGRVDPDATSAFPKPAAYCISSHALGILGIMLAAATVWSMLACVVVVGNPNYVWDALAGG